MVGEGQPSSLPTTGLSTDPEDALGKEPLVMEPSGGDAVPWSVTIYR